MLHDKRSVTLQIRLSEDEFATLQSYAYVHFDMKASTFARHIILDYLNSILEYEDYL